jgi:hypothetical protein
MNKATLSLATPVRRPGSQDIRDIDRRILLSAAQPQHPAEMSQYRQRSYHRETQKQRREDHLPPVEQAPKHPLVLRIELFQQVESHHERSDSAQKDSYPRQLLPRAMQLFETPVLEIASESGGGPASRCQGMQSAHFDADSREEALEKS